MEKEWIYGSVIAACGAFSAAGALCDWDWFVNHRKAWLFMKLFGRTGTRGIYLVLGLGLLVLGVLIALGILPLGDK
jgi:immunity protein 17 of polymorphic toxin system